MSLKIIVAGATGNTGGECVKALSKADNVEIFPFVRDTEKAKGLLDLPNVSALLKGDYSDEVCLSVIAFLLAYVDVPRSFVYLPVCAYKFV